MILAGNGRVVVTEARGTVSVPNRKCSNVEKVTFSAAEFLTRSVKNTQEKTCNNTCCVTVGGVGAPMQPSVSPDVTGLFPRLSTDHSNDCSQKKQTFGALGKF